ncbi:MAG TPA: class I SAM-dependent methyltransferase [Rhodothermales bacterium]|nr:class I SAM-dependent methyltransferase [Rhodothermales bacterium]
MKKPNWRQNLLRRGGFWKNGRWYDLHIERRMPLVLPMLEEMVSALPPLDAGTSVCDLGCGTGNAAFTVLTAYPLIRLTLLDEDPEMLAIAQEKIGDYARDLEVVQATVKADGEAIPGGPYNAVVASLALHAIVGHGVEGAEAESRYELLFRGILEGIAPGGHVMVADHVGTLGLYRHMKAMERAGFTDVDCAWRQDEFFVCGARVAE